MTNRPDRSVKLYPLFLESHSRNHKSTRSEALTSGTHTKTGHNHHYHHHRHPQVDGNGNTDTNRHENDEDGLDGFSVTSSATARSSRSSTATNKTRMKKRQHFLTHEKLENRENECGKQSSSINKKTRADFSEGRIQKCDRDGDASTQSCEEPQVAAPDPCIKPNSTFKRSLGRRIYSDSAMDFVVPRNANIPRHSLLNCLIERSTAGGPLSTNRRMSPSTAMWAKKWRIPSWVSLEPPTTVSHFGGSISKNIECMAWDKMGVLLAISLGKIVSIYDWDMIRAADIQGRRDRARGCRESEWKIAPVLRFRVPHPVASLVWNPFNVDELAVGFRVAGLIQIYNVDRVARWLSNESDSVSSSLRFAPQTTYRSLSVPRINGNVTDIVFLTRDHVVASIGTMMVCWKLPSLVVWRFQPAAGVTSMAPLSANLIVVGTNRGHLSIIDWTIHTKERSFSNERRPLVLQTWIPHAALQMTNDEILLRMGIVKLRIESGTRIDADSITREEHWGSCRITWVTQSGWLLSTTFESPSRLGRCTVHHATPKVTYQNSDGQLITTDKQGWSLPQEPVGVHLSDYAVCLSEVPAVTSILSHHDKFILDSHPCSIRSSKRAILIRSLHDQTLHSISLPKCIKKVPQTLSVHPSLEWIVLAEGDKLHILVGRECKPIDSNNGATRL